jgi:heat shock protein HslJ
MTSRWSLLFVVVTTVGLAGCLSSESSSPTTPGTLSEAQSPVGPTWRLTSLDGQPVVVGTTVTAEFTGENRVAGSSGCNRYMGGATAEAGRLTVSPLASTMMACGQDGVMAQERRYLATLQSATRYSVSAEELRLGTEANAATLVFTSR